MIRAYASNQSEQLEQMLRAVDVCTSLDFRTLRTSAVEGLGTQFVYG